MSDTPFPPLNWLRAFEAAARHLSFTQAAVELNVTQSAVSQHVRSLEAFLGRELFIRRTRALILTEAGANYLPTIREAFGILASGTRAFLGGDRGSSLLVQCNLAFSTFWLVPRLAGLMQAHPWLTLNLMTPIWDPERYAGSAEVEIRFGRPSDVSDAAVRLTHDRYFPICRPGYAADDPDWTRAPLFDCSGVMENWESWLANQGRRMPEGKRIHLGSTYVVSVQAALHGAGLAMAHDTVACDLLASGALVRPQLAHRRHVGGIFPDRASPSRRDSGQPCLRPVAPGRDRAKRNAVATRPRGAARDRFERRRGRGAECGGIEATGGPGPSAPAPGRLRRCAIDRRRHGRQTPGGEPKE